ncbi:MAG: hypothetical protein HPY44_12945 [Armatimonadetes bacterium]|nr:hypothetical protein [Armatimonadota bacterium]
MPGIRETVVLVEPERRNQEHASFNAALLEAVLLAYPEEEVLFLAQEAHLQWARRAYETSLGPISSRVRWQEIQIAPKDFGGIRRLPYERHWCRAVVQLAARHTTRAIILCSVADAGLWLLKGMLNRSSPATPVLAFMHSSLGCIAEPFRRSPWNWFIDLRQVLRSRHPDCLRYIALGPAIHGAVCEILPQVADHFEQLDLPCLWARDAGTDLSDGDCVRFGFFGAPRPGTGFDIFCRLATDMREYSAEGRCEFVLIGFLNTDVPDYPTQDVTGVSHQPLTTEEYCRRGDAITYSIWAGSPAKYRFTASASFVDTLSFVKPGVFLRAPYVESYFAQMGDIGYLCDDYESMRRQITSIIEAPPRDRYREQCANIIRGRRIFSPETVGQSLRALVTRTAKLT